MRGLRADRVQLVARRRNQQLLHRRHLRILGHGREWSLGMVPMNAGVDTFNVTITHKNVVANVDQIISNLTLAGSPARVTMTVHNLTVSGTTSMPSVGRLTTNAVASDAKFDAGRSPTSRARRSTPAITSSVLRRVAGWAPRSRTTPSKIMSIEGVGPSPGRSRLAPAVEPQRDQRSRTDESRHGLVRAEETSPRALQCSRSLTSVASSGHCVHLRSNPAVGERRS